MVTRELVDCLIKSSTVERWTDHVRPFAFTALGKHAHAMAIAWALGRTAEINSLTVDWDYLVRSGLLGLLRSAVLTDIKADVLRDIADHPEHMARLDAFVSDALARVLIGSPDSLSANLDGYLRRVVRTDGERTAMRILRASGALATAWEFRCLEGLNTFMPQTALTRLNIHESVARYADVPGMPSLEEPAKGIGRFADLCGRLRIQTRWSQSPIIPARPVMDHELLVGSLAYCTALDAHPGDSGVAFEAFFGGLFHDLPEVLTRDIVAPVKRGADLEDVLAHIENERLTDELRDVLDRRLSAELRFMVVDEFADKAWSPDPLVPAEGGTEYPRAGTLYPGRLIRECDKFSAFLEASQSISFGISSDVLRSALSWEMDRRVYDFGDLRTAYGPVGSS